MVKVLFVCSGNICRSPTAEGVFRTYVEREGLGDQVVVDSAGTGGWHEGEPPDPRARNAADARGYDLHSLRARRLLPSDYDEFDFLVAMDNGHYRAMARHARPGTVFRMMDFAPDHPAEEVPDPYYGGEADYDLSFELIEAAIPGLLAAVRAKLTA